MGITTDNATSNDKFMDKLSSWMNEYGISFTRNVKHFRCFAHVINLCVKKALQNFDDKLKQVCIYYYLYIYFIVLTVIFLYSYENLLPGFVHPLNDVKNSIMHVKFWK